MQSDTNEKKKLFAFPKIIQTKETNSSQSNPEMEVSEDMNRVALDVLRKTIKTTHELHARMRLLLEEIESSVRK